MDLTVLNDDCLYHILSKLSVRELIKAELVCKKFYEIIQKVYRGRHLLDFDEEYKTHPQHKLLKAEMMVIISKVGKHIDTLVASKNCLQIDCYKNINELLSPKFYGATRNLKELSIVGFNMNDSALDRNFFVRIFSKLKTVKLEDCIFLYDSVLSKCIQEATDLENIDVCSNDLNGESLQFLRDIKKLNYTYNSVLMNEFIVKFCENNKATLKSLHINTTDGENTLIWLKEIVKNLRSLEDLTLFVYISYGESEETIKEIEDSLTTLGDLPYLTSFSIYLDDDAVNINISVLLMKLLHRNMLESLDIYYENEDEETTWKKEAAEIVTKFNNLRVLKYSLEDFTDDHLQKISSKDSLVIADFIKLNISMKTTTDFINQCPNLQEISVPNVSLDDLQERPKSLEIFVAASKGPNINDGKRILLNQKNIFLNYNDFY
ncbi:hypothetical protein DMENIID0001_001270 [Sergentomyia squamirostris]